MQTKPKDAPRSKMSNFCKTMPTWPNRMSLITKISLTNDTHMIQMIRSTLRSRLTNRTDKFKCHLQILTATTVNNMEALLFVRISLK